MFKGLVSLLLLCACSVSVAAKEPIATTIKKVQVYRVATSEIADTYQYPVVVEPKYEREIHAEVTGFAREVFVTIGTVVKPGTALLRLTPTTPGFAEFTITSPMAGEIAQVTKKTGSYIDKGDLLIQIVDPNEFTIKLEVPQAELALLPVKQRGVAKFRTVAIDLPVQVTGVSSFVAAETGTATGQLEWDSESFTANEQSLIKQHIYPGMLGMATFRLHQRRGVTIPSSALLHQKNVDQVRLVKDGKVFKQTIKLGKHLEGGILEVTAGLQAGDIIVMSTGQYLKENEAVMVEERTQD